MAVVQISRIQIRRGRAKSGTGFPQLASGELGWALDTQELYIGNGSVAEGSPAVGNTKILTQNDLTAQGNLLNLLEHVYKANDPSIITGASANDPITRFVQDRLDDRVTVTDFGVVGNAVTDDSIAFQRAIDQLFLNPVSTSSANTPDGVTTRVTLELPPGTYYITEPLYLPSYATIVGAGSDKSIIQYSGSDSAIKFINDSSLIGSPSTISSTLGNTQPRNIVLKGLSIITDTSDQICLQLDAVKDSVFEDLIIEGNWQTLLDNNSRGISLDSVSDIVTCEKNVFKNIQIRGFNFGIYSKKDIRDNMFDNIWIDDVKTGVSFGDGTDESSIGQEFGPRDNNISNSIFTNIHQHAVYIPVGTNNSVINCKLEYVGNNGGDHSTIQYPQIYFGKYNNIAKNIRSDRSAALGLSSYRIEKVSLILSGTITASKGAYVTQASTGAYGYLSEDAVNDSTITLIGIFTNYVEISPGVFDYVSLFNTTNNLTIASDNTPSTTNTAVHPTTIVSVDVTPYISYIPEVSGYGSYASFDSQQFSVGQYSSYTRAFKLPVSTTAAGDPWRSIFYTINYEYKSDTSTVIRKGTINLAANVSEALLHLSDEYEYIGDDSNNTVMAFRAKFLDQTGALYTGAVGQSPFTIEIQYINNINESGKLVYNYTSTF